MATKVIVHCAATPNGRPFTIEDIDSWHVERGFKRTAAARAKFNPDLAACGYHYVIYIGGSVAQGRAEGEVGAHCVGENKEIGICLIGTDKFTMEQWNALRFLVENKGLPAHGHYEFDSAKAQGKTCPNFNVQVWQASGYEVPSENIYDDGRPRGG